MNYDSQSIPFKRGDIVDRNGTVLATSEKVYNLILDPRVLLSKETNVEEPIETIVEESKEIIEITSFVDQNRLL